MENLHRIEGHKQASMLFADCTSSNCGMFAGILSFIVVTGVCVVLLTMSECEYDENQLITNLLRIVLFTTLIIASVYAYYIVACLEVSAGCLEVCAGCLKVSLRVASRSVKVASRSVRGLPRGLCGLPLGLMAGCLEV